MGCCVAAVWICKAATMAMTGDDGHELARWHHRGRTVNRGQEQPHRVLAAVRRCSVGTTARKHSLPYPHIAQYPWC
ncbi:hypothetical protein CPC08DRAFT_381533 [Agrocybe pediades]|nr:hypothetical protein CPC08DRAFT_381533 [Agrocybe pediades]